MENAKTWEKSKADERPHHRQEREKADDTFLLRVATEPGPAETKTVSGQFRTSPISWITTHYCSILWYLFIFIFLIYNWFSMACVRRAWLLISAQPPRPTCPITSPRFSVYIFELKAHASSTLTLLVYISIFSSPLSLSTQLPFATWQINPLSSLLYIFLPSIGFIQPISHKSSFIIFGKLGLIDPKPACDLFLLLGQILFGICCLGFISRDWYGLLIGCCVWHLFGS